MLLFFKIRMQSDQTIMLTKEEIEKIKSQEIQKDDKVSVTIVNWNGGEYIEKCLRSLEKQTHKNMEIIVVDNNSTDESIKILERYSSKIKLIQNNHNLGFSKAHNQAIKAATGKYIMPLNFDVTLDPNFIYEMLKAIKFSSEIGMASGKLYKKKDDKNRIIDTTGITMNNMYPGDRGENHIDKGEYDSYEYIFGASGAAPLLKKEMLEDIKADGEYFDEDFVYYVEDVDLCWRAQIAGWKCIYTPYAIGYHERGATRKEDDTIKKGYYVIGYRNRYCTIFKNSFSSTILKKFFRIVLRETYFYSSQFLGFNFYVFRVPFAFLKMLPAMIKKRRLTMAKKRVCADYMEKFFFNQSLLGALKQCLLK
ncbi:MAG: glycosyltransferase family 2 protein [Candidatus Schekmanbacteria bacterium]|nr:MAG: glycosyltransferase family 2 protein [Candidatus Schekmanbacteria bacterium]